MKRDIAFGRQLESLLPTLMGARIDTLAKAKQARAELLDLAQGSNLGGANTKLLNLRKLPTGVKYPLWSADFFHGGNEGTFNDWVADIAHDPKDASKAAWYALQDTYLANPNNENFWRMYQAAETMTQVPLLGACTLGTSLQLKCGATGDFNRHKFLTALTGQHMMRLEAMGRGIDEFVRGPIGFSYLDTDASVSFMKTRKGFPLLPADFWEIGDRGRVMLESTNTAGSFKQNLQSLGFPDFAINSIDPNRSAGQEMHELRLAWFWIGFTMDPSFARIHGSNATKTGEYMVATLLDERMFNHNMFAGLMRLATKGALPEANVLGRNNPNRLEQLPTVHMMQYSYLWGYNRTVLDTKWHESKGIAVPQALKNELTGIWQRLAGNGFRMNMYLQLDELAQGRVAASEQTLLKSWLANSINTNGTIRNNGLWAMYQHFNRYHQASLSQDVALLEQLKAATGITEAQW